MNGTPDEPGDARGPTTRTHFPPLDGLRGVAILLVLLNHTFHYEGTDIVGRSVEAVARFGWSGVTLFFVLSGFLISGILLDTRGRPHYLRDFFARRSLRIFPLYFAFLAAYFLVAPRIPGVAALLPSPPGPTRLLCWTYTANMREALSGCADWTSPLAPLWSLAVEEQVYLFWPFLILLVPPRRLAAVLVGLAVVSFAWRLGTRWTRQSIELTYEWTPANLEAFAAGALVASWLRTRVAALESAAPLVAAASGLLILGVGWRLGHFNFWYSPVIILTGGSTLLVALYAATIAVSATTNATAPLNRALAAGWLREAGKYSYAMYLFHAPIREVLEPIIFSRTSGLVAGRDVTGQIACVLATCGCSYGAARLSWHLWEAPFLRLKRHFPLSGGVPRPVAGPHPAIAGGDR